MRSLFDKCTISVIGTFTIPAYKYLTRARRRVCTNYRDQDAPTAQRTDSMDVGICDT